MGVFEDPKEANAPDPNPNALDAPTVGDAKAVELKGFARVLCDDRPPPFLLTEDEGVGKSLGGPAPFAAAFPVERESLEL